MKFCIIWNDVNWYLMKNLIQNIPYFLKSFCETINYQMNTVIMMSWNIDVLRPVMRSRRRSSVQLDSYYRIVYQTILRHQDPNTGLLPGDAGRMSDQLSLSCLFVISLLSLFTSFDPMGVRNQNAWILSAVRGWGLWA